MQRPLRTSMNLGTPSCISSCPLIILAEKNACCLYYQPSPINVTEIGPTCKRAVRELSFSQLRGFSKRCLRLKAQSCRMKPR